MTYSNKFNLSTVASLIGVGLDDLKLNGMSGEGIIFSSTWGDPRSNLNPQSNFEFYVNGDLRRWQCYDISLDTFYPTNKIPLDSSYKVIMSTCNIQDLEVRGLITFDGLASITNLVASGSDVLIFDATISGDFIVTNNLNMERSLVRKSTIELVGVNQKLRFKDSVVEGSDLTYPDTSPNSTSWDLDNSYFHLNADAPMLNLTSRNSHLTETAYNEIPEDSRSSNSHSLDPEFVSGISNNVSINSKLFRAGIGGTHLMNSRPSVTNNTNWIINRL